MTRRGVRRGPSRLMSLLDSQQVGRYATVGMASAFMHLGLLIVLVRGWGLSPLLASSLGFVTVALFAFVLHHRWVYTASEPMRTTAPRFFSVATVAFLVNAITMSLGSSSGSSQYIFAQLIAFVLMPLSNYIVHTLWTFADRR